MPTLEEQLNFKNQSLSSFLPKEDSEEAIVSDALAAPVRPEFLKFLEEQRKSQPMAGFTSPEERAIEDLNEYDRLKALPSGQKSLWDEGRLADLAKMAKPSSSETNAPSKPFFPTLTGAPIPDDSLKTSQAAPVAAKPVAREPAVSPATEDSALANLLKSQESEQSSYANLLNRFKEAQEQQRKSQLLVGLTQAAEKIGSSIAMTKPGDQAPYGQAMKLASNVVDEFTKEYQMASEAERRDPNSPLSKSYQDIIKSMGIGLTGNESAETLIKVLPYLQQYQSQKENREFRQKELELRFAEIAARKDQGRSEKQDRFIQALRKETTSGAFGKMFNNYTTAARMLKGLEEFIKDPTGYKDFGMIMGGLKALQGDESVVKEAELRLGMTETVDWATKIGNWVRQKATGKMLSAKQRKEIIDAVRVFAEVSARNYTQAIEPIMKQAENIGIDKNMLINQGFLESSLVQKSATESAQKTTIKLAQKLSGKAGKTFTDNKTGKKYIVNPDETSATEL